MLNPKADDRLDKGSVVFGLALGSSRKVIVGVAAALANHLARVKELVGMGPHHLGEPASTSLRMRGSPA